jgi:SAM-dependent methyltransferase
MLGDDLLAVLGDAVPRERVAQALADDYIPRLAAGSVIDLGCGAGDSVVQFRNVNPSVRWVGVDIERSPEVASRRRTDAEFVTFDGVRLPFGEGSFDAVYCKQVLEHVREPGPLLAEVARVLRPGGRWVFSVTHPMRWIFPDDPGPDGLVAGTPYFDRTPYVEVDDLGRATYVEHHRTLGDRIREIVGAGLVLTDLVEPEWPEGHDQEWGQWSPLRGRLFPGTAIFVCDKPGS